MSLLEVLKAKWSATLIALDNVEHRAEELRVELADLDRAIAALSPAPSEALGEAEIPEGFVKWEGGACPVDERDQLEIVIRDATVLGAAKHEVLRNNAGDLRWTHENIYDDIIAYRVLPSEPAAEAKGDSAGNVTGAAGLQAEDDAKMRDLLCLTFDERRGWDAHWSGAPISKCYVTPNAQGECECCNGWNKREACITGAQAKPITIAASEQHAEESARAQDPLLPPERPPVATPEQLEATGVIDGEAGWWGRKLIKERA